MDASQWPQHHQIGGLARAMEEIQAPNNNTMMNPNLNSSSNSMVERKLVKPQNKDKVNCPRCNSTNTKFCYYNNYSQTQPRYFCKTCRRYWTHGGSLRNVPVGGGSRKKINKRSSPSISSSSKIIINPNLTPPNTLPHLINPPPIPNNNKLLFQLDAHDLNLAFPIQGNISNSTPMVPMSNSQLYPSGLPDLHEFKAGFSSSHGGDSINGARLLFPFADMNKLASPTNKSDHHDHQDQDHDHYDHHHHEGATGYYWSGMLGGGTW